MGVQKPSWRSCIGPSTSSSLEYFVICTAGLQINAVVQNVRSAMAEAGLEIHGVEGPSDR